MSKRGTSASGYQASREKYKCPVKECQKSELRGDDIPLGQVSGITSILEVEQSIDSCSSAVYRPLAYFRSAITTEVLWFLEFIFTIVVKASI